MMYDVTAGNLCVLLLTFKRSSKFWIVVRNLIYIKWGVFSIVFQVSKFYIITLKSSGKEVILHAGFHKYI